MRMKVVDIKNFPIFYNYVKNDITKLKNVQPILRAIKRFSGETKVATIKQGLTWSHGSIIEIVPMLICGEVRAYGCYAWGGNVIQIDRSLVRAYEAGTDRRATREGRMVNVAGVTLLHELTHWSDAKDGVDNPVPGDPANEEGNAFEREVYGRIIQL